MSTKTYAVKGMHCASCAAIITKKLSAVEGIRLVNVNLATEKGSIEFDSDTPMTENEVNDVVGKYGYTLLEVESDEAACPLQETAGHEATRKKDEKREELQEQLGKVQFALPVALMVFLLMMWDTSARLFSSVPNLPIPMEMLNIITMALATWMVFRIGAPFLHGITMFIRTGAAGMDTLIGIGTLTAYLYSAVITLLPQAKELLRIPDYTYFDVTIVVIGFVLLGKYLEARSKLKTGEAIEKLIGLQAKSALILRAGKEIEVPAASLKKGDLVIVKPGATVPVDGIITEGSSSIDESMVTGEPVPADKKAGDEVTGGTINHQGSFTFSAMRVGSETVLARIIRMVEDAQGSKAPIQNIADKIAAVFVPAVLVLAALTFIVWLTVGSSLLGFSVALSYALMGMVGILVIACPCALGLATPTAIITGVGKGAEYGILVRNAESLEKLSAIDTVVFDKTGTITRGMPEVTDIATFDPKTDSLTLLRLAASVENRSEHPLAKAVVDAAAKRNLPLGIVTAFEALEGMGVSALVDDLPVRVRRPVESECLMPEVKALQEEGKTIAMIELNGVSSGLIAMSDTIKEHAREAVTELRRKGLRVIMLTGDNLAAANHIAEQAGIGEVLAEVRPHEKAEKIKVLQAQGRKVAMAGDGINDAPALAQADVGIAMATGTDIAMESAGITLLKGDISKIAQAIRLSRSTMRVIRQNLFWAFIYNVIGIPLAAGAFYPFFGIFLSPVFSGIAMAGSSVSVVSNSLRLKALKL